MNFFVLQFHFSFASSSTDYHDSFLYLLLVSKSILSPPLLNLSMCHFRLSDCISQCAYQIWIIFDYRFQIRRCVIKNGPRFFVVLEFRHRERQILKDRRPWTYGFTRECSKFFRLNMPLWCGHRYIKKKKLQKRINSHHEVQKHFLLRACAL